MNKRTIVVVALGAIMALIIGWQVTAFATVTTDSGFEGGDGNLAPNGTTPNFDWNSFAPMTWTGTAPNRIAEKSQAGWTFDGLEDAQATTSDNGFAGGTKQDAACPTVITAKAPNKDDLKRAYFASKTAANGDIFLELAWVRITQNTTSPSAHVAFEFNQSKTLCSPNTGGLVTRTAGDMLIVYDFEGGATDTPTLRLSRWITSGTCEVASNSPPCWGVAQQLDDTESEARVNTSAVGPVSDAIHPDAPPAQQLGLNEFGEAGINLTKAGVFTAGQCTSFGKAYAVSRTSGTSSRAQMKDLVGPGNVDINNCGGVTIRKVTVPSPDPTDTTFTYDTTGGLEANDPGFSLKDGESKDFGTQVQSGSYSVTEADPSPGFALSDIGCSASNTPNGTSITIDETNRTVSFDLDALDSVDCTFANTRQTGAIEITKTRKHAADGAGDHPHAGVTFTISDNDPNTTNDPTATTDADGKACVDGLAQQSYNVIETVPAGYVSDDSEKPVTVDNAASCTDDPYGGETVSFHNTPLTNITLSVDSQVDGGTASTIDCGTPPGQQSTGANGDGSVTRNDLEPGTYTCTVVVDP